MSGKVYIIGAGPGDPELITVKAAKILGRADVVLYDRLVPHGLVERYTGRTELIYVGKEPGQIGLSQDEINKMLAEHAKAGRIVVRLKGGDPFIFGRGEEECAYLLSSGIRCEIVPGLTSATAAPACAGIPVTSRWAASSFAVVTGREASEKPVKRVKLTDIASTVDVLVVLMGVSKLEEVVGEVLKSKDPKTPAAIIVDGCTQRQRVVTSSLDGIVEAARKEHIAPPAVLIVGSTIGIMERRALGGQDI